MLRVEQGSIKYHFLSLWYDSTRDWTQISRAIGEHCTHYANVRSLIGQVGRVFTNGPGDLGSIQGRVIPKTLKVVLDTSLLNTQQYKTHIKGKVEQSRESINALPYALV